MLKPISFTTTGQKTLIADLTIYRFLPSRYADAVGPFVLLDHFPPGHADPKEPRKTIGTGAHPHRGLATLTYLIQGEGEHHDSRGHHATIRSGGAQWMKAGNGIIHDEVINADAGTGDLLIHGFQFWINLPSKIKAELPEYLSLQAKDIPVKKLGEGAGWIKIIVGDYEELSSKIPNYSRQFLYHIHLLPGATFSLPTDATMEYAALLPTRAAMINTTTYQTGEFIEFGKDEGTIEINNKSELATDIILFGGEPYTEPIIARGPFVMNSDLEIAQAYKDFHAGKYGII